MTINYFVSNILWYTQCKIVVLTNNHLVRLVINLLISKRNRRLCCTFRVRDWYFRRLAWRFVHQHPSLLLLTECSFGCCSLTCASWCDSCNPALRSAILLDFLIFGMFYAYWTARGWLTELNPVTSNSCFRVFWKFDPKLIILVITKDNIVDSAALRPVIFYEIEIFFQSTFFVATQVVSFLKRKYNSSETCAVHSKFPERIFQNKKIASCYNKLIYF